MLAIVHPANIADRDGADWVLEAAIEKSRRLRHVWADSGCTGELIDWWQTERGITIEIVGKQPGQRTFVVAPRRWVVETTQPQYPAYTIVDSSAGSAHHWA